jgi:hypothetical protein
MSAALELPTRWLKRPPAKVAGRKLADLGSALEIETGDHLITWSRGRAALTWDPRSRSLVIFEGGKRGKPGPAPTGPAARAHERWSDYEAGSMATLSVQPRGRWRSVGPVSRLDYASDKFDGRMRGYTHDTGPRVRVYLHGSLTKLPRVWVVRGGRLNVTARGIVG